MAKKVETAKVEVNKPESVKEVPLIFKQDAAVKRVLTQELGHNAAMHMLHGKIMKALCDL